MDLLSIIKALTGNAESALQGRLNRLAAREIGEINMLFVKHKIGAWIDRRRVSASPTAGFIRYYLIASDKVTKVESVEKDLSVLISRLRNAPIAVNIRTPGLFIELPYPFEMRPLAWADANLDALGSLEMVIGRNYSGAVPQPVTMNYRDLSQSHMLISGTTGSGKTMMLVGGLLSLCWATSPADAQIIILDPKGSRDLAPLVNLPHVTLFHETQDCADAIASVKAEMNRRKRQNVSQRIFLVVEELAELMIEVGTGRGTLFEQLKSLTGVGRELGVHVIACTQRASVDVVDPVMRSNLPIRLAGKVGTQEESRIATGVSDAGCETLPGRGSFQYVNNSAPVRLQSHYVGRDEVPGIAHQIAGKWGHKKAYQIEVVFTEAGDENEVDSEMSGYIKKVLDNIGIEDVFDDSGKPAYGIKSRIIRLILGENANPGGANDRLAKRLLGELKKLTTSTEA